MVAPKRFLRLTWFSSAVSYEAAGKIQRLREEKQQKSFNIKVPDPLSPGMSPGSFMSNEFAMMCSFICVCADSSACGLYIHDPKLICNKSAQRPEEIQNKSHGLACSPLCSISLVQILKHIDSTLTASLLDQWLFPNDFFV